MIRTLFVFLLSLVYANDCVSLSYSPAKFGEYESLFMDRLVFPDGFETGVVLIRCAADVSKWGGFQTNFCFHDDKKELPFVRKVSEALGRGRVEPAKVGDHNVGVWFQYSVLFEKSNGVEKISIYPHHLRNLSDFGLNYISPQPFGRARFWRGCRRSLYILAEAEVGVDGKGTPRMVMGKDSSDYCKEMVSTLISESSYIPGFFMGTPQKMRFIETFFSGDVVEK